MNQRVVVQTLYCDIPYIETTILLNARVDKKIGEILWNPKELHKLLIHKSHFFDSVEFFLYIGQSEVSFETRKEGLYFSNRDIPAMYC